MFSAPTPQATSIQSTKPKLLFATIAAGGGHVATARAMAQAVETLYPGAFEITLLDYMKEVGVVGFDRRHKEMWRWALRFPFTARLGQRVIDGLPQLAMQIQRRMLLPFARAARQDLELRRPDLIISNHGLLTTGLALAKRRLGLKLPVLTFATETHNISAYWADPLADHIIVPNEGVKRDLERMGVPASKVSVVGYPVQQDFLHVPNKTEAQQQLGLEGFTCLVSLGGEGVGGDIEGILSPLLALGAVRHVVVICGRNEALKTTLQHHYAGTPKVRVEGFVSNMATYLAASDVVIGKAGPASVYETLAVGRPMLMTSYAGLNEKGVLEFVVAKGLGAYLPHPDQLKAEVLRYATTPDLLGRVAKEASALGLERQTAALAQAVVRYAREHAEGQARAR